MTFAGPRPGRRRGAASRANTRPTRCTARGRHASPLAGRCTVRIWWPVRLPFVPAKTVTKKGGEIIRMIPSQTCVHILVYFKANDLRKRKITRKFDLIYHSTTVSATVPMLTDISRNPSPSYFNKPAANEHQVDIGSDRTSILPSHGFCADTSTCWLPNDRFMFFFLTKGLHQANPCRRNGSVESGTW